jgi:hypothetical protein
MVAHVGTHADDALIAVSLSRRSRTARRENRASDFQHVTVLGGDG